MKKILILPILVMLAGCQGSSEYDYEYVDGYYAEYDAPYMCDGMDESCVYVRGNADRYSNVKYVVTDDNGLVLETKNHVVQVAGQPDKKYMYYVWAGDKTTADDPDLIINDGVAAVLVQE